MSLVRAEDLTLTFDGESVLVRAVTRGVGAKVPPVAVALLAFHATPRTRDEVLQAFGPRVAPLADGLADAGLLVPPEDAHSTPVFFGGFGRVDVHRRMIEDTARVDAYAAAIAATVKPGMVVVDAGTGTGLLAVMAAKAGATVYAIDNTDVLDIAQQVIQASGVADRVTLIRGDFAQVELPEPADLVVTETFGALALAEGAARDLAAGTTRWLKQDGLVLPGRIDLFFTPLVGDAVYNNAVGIFDTVHGVDLHPLRGVASLRGATLSVTEDQVLPTSEPAMTLAFPGQEGGTGSVSVDVDGVIGGFAGWFDLHLAPGHVLSTSPMAPHTHWRQLVMPWAELTTLRGRLEASFEVLPDPQDRRGLEVRCTWRCGDDSGQTTHRVR